MTRRFFRWYVLWSNDFRFYCELFGCGENEYIPFSYLYVEMQSEHTFQSRSQGYIQRIVKYLYKKVRG